MDKELLKKIVSFLQAYEADIPYPAAPVVIAWREQTQQLPCWPVHALDETGELVRQYSHLIGCHHYVYGYELAREITFHYVNGMVAPGFSHRQVYGDCLHALKLAAGIPSGVMT